MARRRRKEKDEAPPPVSVAGLMTFLEEEVGGVKVRPELVIAMAMTLSLLVIFAHLGILAP